MLAADEIPSLRSVTSPQGPLRRVAFAAALAVLLLATWGVYHPGLSGDFLFDDFGNLPAIGATGPIDHWATFWRYITSGNADPTGRPLTLLTFLIDARDWPAAPYPFKVTNVLVHLLNGALLAAVLLKLGTVLRLSPRQARLAALFGAGAWLLHPLLVSTTLYIVQREAMLPATFTLAGILGWIHARGALARGDAKRGLTGMALAAWGCTLLAMLCKANGALLPLFLLLIEWIVLALRQPMPAPALARTRVGAIAILLVLPTALLVVWMLTAIPSMTAVAVHSRDWTPGQRLLTEARVLADYLRLLFLPRAHSSGLFNDAFAASTDWLHPRTTLPCAALILGLIGAGFALRKRQPAIALALLFYFAGHLLESTWLPLELYYEHRNYLPAMLLFWPIGIALGSPRIPGSWGATCAAALLIGLGAVTFQRAELWGDGFRQSQIWAAFNEDSARAQASAAQYDMAHGRPRLAAARLRNALPAHPQDLQIPVNLIGAECQLGGVQPQTLAAARRALRTTRLGGTLGFNWFNEATELARNRDCSGLDFTTVQALLDAARQNPHWRASAGRRQDLAHLQGLLDLAQGNPGGALQEFDRALAFDPRPDTALEQAAILGSRGYPELGLAQLDYYSTLPAPSRPDNGMPMLHAWVLERQHYWSRETARLRTTLQTDAAGKARAKRTAKSSANR
jgi:tetratricopeptide (TPR) repeat protein